MIAEGSMKLPAISSTTLSTSRKVIGEKPCSTTHWGDGLGDLLGGQHVGEQHRVGDDEHQHDAQARRVQDHPRAFADTDVAIDHQ